MQFKYLKQTTELLPPGLLSSYLQSHSPCYPLDTSVSVCFNPNASSLLNSLSWSNFCILVTRTATLPSHPCQKPGSYQKKRNILLSFDFPEPISCQLSLIHFKLDCLQLCPEASLRWVNTRRTDGKVGIDGSWEAEAPLEHILKKWSPIFSATVVKIMMKNSQKKQCEVKTLIQRKQLEQQCHFNFLPFLSSQ